MSEYDDNTGMKQANSFKEFAKYVREDEACNYDGVFKFYPTLSTPIIVLTAAFFISKDDDSILLQTESPSRENVSVDDIVTVLDKCDARSSYCGMVLFTVHNYLTKHDEPYCVPTSHIINRIIFHPVMLGYLSRNRGHRSELIRAYIKYNIKELMESGFITPELKLVILQT